MLKNDDKFSLKVMFAFAIILLLLLSAIFAYIPTANAQIPTRKTAAYLSVNPPLIGLGQPLTVNLWVYPSPSTRNFQWSDQRFNNITITFTRPDGTTDSFKPVDGSGGLEPGETEMIGAIWFIYNPNQIGTWTVKFSFPGQTIGSGNESVFYDSADSPPTTFEVQSQEVRIGLDPVALPTDYWNRPIHSNNREWSAVSGNWLQSGYDYLASYYNPYSKAVNAAHIVWKNVVSAGGIVGGEWGGISYGGGGASPSIIVSGNIYYNIAGGYFRAVDLRTGQTVYEKPGSITRAEIVRPMNLQAGTEQTQGTSPTAFLWGQSATSWTRYNAYTGELLQTITNVPSVSAGSPGSGVSGSLAVTWVDRNHVYIVRQSGWNTTIPYKLAINELIKWDYDKVTGNDWLKGVVWNVTLPSDAPGNGGRPTALWPSGDVGIVNCPGENSFLAYDLNTGTFLYKKTFDFVNMGRLYGDDKYFAFDSVTSRYHCFDFKTGNELWVSDVIGNYPWGVNQYPRAVAYGKLFVGSYDGYLYAIDVKTGKIDWKFFCGNTTETVFGSWAFYIGGPSADGKYYMATSEHTPTQPRIRGNRLFCIDVYTGNEVWNISSAINAQAIAEGYLVGVSEDDGVQYCFGKGQTLTTVTASSKTPAKGSSILIEGTVTDQSPAQRGTPAISDTDMNVWMEYLHMQKPKPEDVKGVKVQLTAIDPDGKIVDIGSTTSTSDGNFALAWTPPTEGLYWIKASFAGSESYWGSTAQTAVSVSAAANVSPAPVESPTPAVQPGVETSVPLTTYIAVAAVAIVAVVVAVALILRRRAK